MRNSTTGFTIVELLIVIVVIAILAAISVVAYTGIQDRALASTVKSDLANLAKKIELAKVDSVDGQYPAALTAAMGMQVTKSAYRTIQNNVYYCTAPDRSNYAFGGTDRRLRGYSMSSINGLQENVSVSGTSICAIVGGGPSFQVGHQWDAGTSTGTWQSWVN